ncbi:MAG: MMPL family transporter [Planctomycetota bacterium]
MPAARARNTIGLAALAVIGLVLAALSVPGLRRDTSLAQLFPAGSPAGRAFADFDAAFGTDDLLLVAVRDAGAESPEVFRGPYLQFLDRVTLALEADPAVEKAISLANLLDLRVVSERLPPLPRPLLPRARDRVDPSVRERIGSDPLLSQGLLSTDGATAAVWVLLRPELRQRDDYVAQVRRVADTVPPPPPGTGIEVLVTGDPLVQGAALDLLTRDAFALAAAALLVIAVVAALARVPLRAAFAFLAAWPMVLGLLATWANLADRPLHAFSNSVPPLLLVTSSASFVHLAHALQRGRRAARSTLAACALAALTTAVGFGSLAFSRLAPLAALGIELAAGTGLAFVLCTGAVLCADVRTQPAADAAARGLRWRAGPMLVLAAALLALPWPVIQPERFTSLGDPLDLLPQEHPAVRDAARVAEWFGEPTAVEVVVAIDPEQLTDPELLLGLERFEAALRATAGGDIHHVLSPVTLLRALQARLDPADATAPTEPLRRSTADYAIRHLLRPYLRLADQVAPETASPLIATFRDWMRHLLATTGNQLRFGCRVSRLDADALLKLVARLRAEVFSRFETELGVRRIEATGYAVLVAEAAAEVRATQVQSLAFGGGALALLLWLVARGTRRWLLALAANALTLSGVVTVMWLLRATLDPFSAVLAASLLAVLIDDTIHVLWALRQASAEGAADPTAAALQRVSPPVLLSSLCLAAGFAVFFCSALPQYQRFAATALAAIGLALVWDLYALPAALRRVERRR